MLHRKDERKDIPRGRRHTCKEHSNRQAGAAPAKQVIGRNQRNRCVLVCELLDRDAELLKLLVACVGRVDGVVDVQDHLRLVQLRPSVL